MAGKVRQIRRRKKAVEKTKQITRAMELIAASRIIRAQSRAVRARPYAKAIGEMVEMLSGEVKESALLNEREQIRNVGLIVISSDRGLCGGYNVNVLREADRARKRESDAGRGMTITAAGRKGISYFRFRRLPLAAEFIGISDTPTYENAKSISSAVIEDYVSGRTDKVLLAYTDFVSASLQRARVAQILPAVRAERAKVEGPRALFDFEPEPEALLDALLPRYVEAKVYAALLESAASEHAARRRAMKDATDNALELIKLLKRDEDRARQAEITSEIADIVGAAVAISQ